LFVCLFVVRSKNIASIGKLLDRKVADSQSVQKDFLATRMRSLLCLRSDCWSAGLAGCRAGRLSGWPAV
jgi:hypothetical protein